MADTLNKNVDNYPYFNLTANYRNSSTITVFLSKLINKFYQNTKIVIQNLVSLMEKT